MQMNFGSFIKQNPCHFQWVSCLHNISATSVESTQRHIRSMREGRGRARAQSTHFHFIIFCGRMRLAIAAEKMILYYMNTRTTTLERYSFEFLYKSLRSINTVTHRLLQFHICAVIVATIHYVLILVHFSSISSINRWVMCTSDAMSDFIMHSSTAHAALVHMQFIESTFNETILLSDRFAVGGEYSCCVQKRARHSDCGDCRSKCKTRWRWCTVHR